MPIPDNITIETAYDLGAELPVTYSQEQHFGGTTYPLWFKLTVPDDVNMLLPWMYGNAGTWNPVLSCWRNLASPEQIGNSSSAMPMQIAVTPGETIYFKTIKPFGNTNPAVTHVDILAGPTDDLAAGDIAINDSSEDYPAVIMNPATAEPKAFRHPFAAGEGTAVLRHSGIVCALDISRAGGGVKVYDSNFNVLVTPTMPASGYDDSLGTNQVDTFWVGKNASGMSNPLIVSMNRLGVFGAPIDVGATARVNGIAPNADGSLVYLQGGFETVNLPIYVIDTVTLIATLFLAGVANYTFGANIMTLTDDSVLVPYARSGFATLVKRYNAAGVLQNTYTFAVDFNIERIFAAIEDPTYFWLWSQTSTQNVFTKVKVSDGSVTTAGPWPKFIEGVSQEALTLTPTARCGADFSCVPWILRNAPPVGVTRKIRRTRRFPLPFDRNLTVFVSRMEFIQQQGIGLTSGQGEDPLIDVRFSGDGGQTWGPLLQVPCGRIGEYMARSVLNSVGRLQNGYCEISVSDPVAWAFVQAVIDYEVATQ